MKDNLSKEHNFLGKLDLPNDIYKPLKTGKSIHEIAVVERKLISQFKWDEIYSLENLITPKYINA
jgi:aspartate ammonia-lyase